MHRIRKFSQTRKQSKYKNVPRDYNGHQYHSIFEAKVARDLDWRVKAGEIVSWERQVKISLYAYGAHICDYFIDFVAVRPDGTKEYIEAKGFVTDVWRLKWKLFEAQMREKEPDAQLIIIKK